MNLYAAGGCASAAAAVSPQDTNESLALRSSAVSEQELEEVRAEAAQRVAAAERKVPPEPPPPSPPPPPPPGALPIFPAVAAVLLTGGYGASQLACHP